VNEAVKGCVLVGSGREIIVGGSGVSGADENCTDREE
jgi:hypothetical protein